MKNYSIKPRGFEQSALVMSGTEIVAEVFTDTEPGDQHQIAALFAAAPDLLEALRVGLFHTEKSAVRAKSLARWNKHGGMDGIAAGYEQEATESEQAADFIRAIITQATGESK